MKLAIVLVLCCLLTIVTSLTSLSNYKTLPQCKPPLITSNSHLTYGYNNQGVSLRRRNSRSSSDSSGERITRVGSFKVGTILRLRCQNGYILQGSKYLICLYKNKAAYWLPKLPKCIKKYNRDRSNSDHSGSSSSSYRKRCSRISSPSGGVVKLTGTRPGCYAVYRCYSNRVLKGNRIRKCQRNGKWTGLKPSCIINKINCGDPGKPINGYRKLGKTTLYSQVIYYCKKGYKLVGHSKRKCLKSGKWSGKLPLCKGTKQCSTLTAPLYGQVIVKSYTPDSCANYTCNDGYKLIGDHQRVCLPSGQWTGKTPICQRISKDCEILPNPDNGQVIQTGTTVGSKATYSCNKGYFLTDGHETRQCLENGNWSGKQPSCEIITCTQLTPPTNGAIQVTGLSYGSTAIYTCYNGFELNGDYNRTCLGEWTGTMPTCQPIDCGPLDPPHMGQVDVSGTVTGSIATYSCFFGYKLVGETIRECTLEGQWSNTAPICDIIDCGPLNDPSNGVVDFSATILSSLASYTCNNGFIISGNNTRECLSNEKWSGNEPTCNEITCPPLSDPIQGHVTISGTSIGSVAEYTCIGGHLLQGEYKRICGEDGKWGGKEPYCNPIEGLGCERLPDPEYGQVTIEGQSIGSIATYTCITGYYISKGNQSRICQKDYTWSGTPAKCEGVTCPPLFEISNGEVNYNSNLFGTQATYSCTAGHTLTGPSIRTCTENSTWSGETPFCLPESTGNNNTVKCTAPNNLQNGRITSGVNNTSTSSYEVGDMISYTCNTGYVLMGNEMRLCQTNGQFTGREPTCEIVQATCTGSNTITHDTCGRRCTCENGNLVQCCGVRKDWVELTSTEKQQYIQAVKTLATNPDYKPSYDTLVKEYQASFNTTAQATDPTVSQYLPYIRTFLLKYESLLQAVDCRITIPYWDFTALPLAPYTHPIWDNVIGFGNNSRPSDNCVTSGPFSYDQFNTPANVCLKRSYRTDRMYPSRSMLDRDILPLPAEEFNTFHRNIQLLISTSVLCNVGGDLCGDSPASDPIFLLFLSYLDFTFDRWQSFGQGRESVRYSQDSTPLVFASPFKVSDFASNKNLPNDIAICYSPPVFHKRHPPPSLPFQSSLIQQTITPTHPNTITAVPDCVNENDMRHFMSMSSEDESFMDNACNKEREFENLSRS